LLWLPILGFQCDILGFRFFGVCDIWDSNKKGEKAIITGSGNPTGEDTQNGAQMATQSDIGAELGASPGHDSEVEAFN
jgi:hypothetical protein